MTTLGRAGSRLRRRLSDGHLVLAGILVVLLIGYLYGITSERR